MKKILLPFLLILFSASCGSDKPKVQNYYEEEVTYVFSRFIEKEDKYIYRFPLGHPLKITQKEMDKMMLSLKYQPGGSFFDFLSSDNNNVFEVQTVIDVAPQFRRKLAELQPEEKLVFAIVDSQERTSGEVFVVGNGLHWRFDYVKGEPYIKDQKKILDWLAPWTEEDESFRLVAQKGQWYHVTHAAVPRAGNRNWVILPLHNRELTKKDDVMIDYLVRESMDSNREEARKILTNKLMMLRKEYEGGVISYEEFQKRREVLLDAL